MTLRWEPEALEDRQSTLEFISADGPRTAVLVDGLIVEAALKRDSNRGRAGRGRGTRELVNPNTRYSAAYRIEGDTIVVLGVVDGGRRWPRMRKPR